MKSLLLLSIVALGIPLAAAAATITVNTTADNATAADGTCTLREAIANVNAAADTSSGDCTAGTGGGDAIAFNVVLPATIKLKHRLGELAIGQNVTIAGPSGGDLHIRGSYGARNFEITAGTTSMSNLTIQDGKRVAGAGILVRTGASLELTKCTLHRNKADPDGGGIYNRGTATLTNCTFSRNHAAGGGAAIFNDVGALLTLTNCTLVRNSSRGYYAAGGGISNDGMATLTNCTLYHNRAYQGGGIGIANGGAVTLTNCTLSHNQAANKGNSTNQGNTYLGGGSGIWNHDGIVTLTNTIVANGLGRSPANCSGDIASAGHNLDSDGTCLGGTAIDPMLAALADYGGPTKTLALCTALGVPLRSCATASPAIDAGDDAVTGPPDNLATDQRGLARQAGAHVDIGAYEVQ